MPRFTGSKAGVWTLRVYQQTWARPEDSGHSVQVRLGDLVGLPEQALEAREGRWHLPTECLPAELWASFDTRTLANWRFI